MSERTTWKWIEQTLFPLLVADAVKAGIPDAAGWRMYTPANTPVLVDRDMRTLRHFQNPSDAETQIQAMRYAWGLVREAKRDAERTSG